MNAGNTRSSASANPAPPVANNFNPGLEIYPDLAAPMWNAIRIGAVYFVIITLTLMMLG